MYQLDDRTCLRPNSLISGERKHAQRALAFLMEKRSREVKGRMVFNVKPMREWMSKEDSISPTAGTEGLFLLAMIDAHERRNMMVNDVPNVFIQALLKLKPGQENVIMKIMGILVDILVEKNLVRSKIL